MTKEEFDNLMLQTGRSSSHGEGESPRGSSLKHGAVMAASVLNGPRAVSLSVYVVRTFLRLRQELIARIDMEKRLPTANRRRRADRYRSRFASCRSRPSRRPRGSAGAGHRSEAPRARGHRGVCRRSRPGSRRQAALCWWLDGKRQRRPGQASRLLQHTRRWGIFAKEERPLWARYVNR